MLKQATPMSQIIQTWNLINDQMVAPTTDVFYGAYLGAQNALIDAIKLQCCWMVSVEKLVEEYGVDLEVAKEFVLQAGPFDENSF